MATYQKERFLFLVSLFIQICILCSYTNSDEESRKPLTCALLTISFLNFMFSRSIFLESNVVYEKWLITAVSRYLFCTIFYYVCREIYPKFVLFKTYFPFILYLAVDVMRACFSCYVTINFEKQLISCFYNDLLKLEFFFLVTEKRIEEARNYEPTIRSFKNLGTPKEIDSKDCFDKWKLRNDDLIKDYKSLVSSGIDWLEENNAEENGETDLSAEELILNLHEITKESLNVNFGSQGSFIFSAISFLSAKESLAFPTFEQNMRQINLERNNLFVSLQKMYKLIAKVKFIGYAIEIALLLALVFLFPASGTFIFVFLITFTIYLVRPSLGRIAESAFFILLTNPYNVGDKVKLKHDIYFVRKVSLLSTVFQKWSGEMLTMNNEIVSNEFVLNYMRSASQQWETTILIPRNIEMEFFDELRDRCKIYCSQKRAIFKIKINFSEIENNKMLKVVFHAKHVMNFQNAFFMWNNQNEFMTFLVETLDELNIKYVPLEREIELIPR